VLCGPSTLCAVSALECLLSFYRMEDLTETRSKLVGFDDEMMDVAFLDDTRVVVASTSSAARVYNIDPESDSSPSTTFLSGHSGPVLSCCVSKKGGFIVTGSKDQTARAWSTKDFSSLGVCAGHNDAVTAVAACEESLHFVTAGGEDKTLQLWKISPLSKAGPVSLLHKVAHTKAITDVCVSPNDNFVGTASLDKTARVWSLNVSNRPSLDLVVELKGHRRAVNCISFSRVDRVAITASADCTLKIWNITDGSCVRTLEGHASPCTKALFLSNGSAVASAGSDGVVKTWDLKTSSCLQTSMEHTDKVWSLALNSQQRLVSVGEGGVRVVWDDASEANSQKRFEESRLHVIEKDELDRAVRQGDLLKAAALSLKLKRPHQLKTVLQNLDQMEVDNVIQAMVVNCDVDALKSLMGFCVGWNTQSRSSLVAQRVIRALLDLRDLPTKVGRSSVEDFCDEVLPYTKRHQARLDKLVKTSYLIDHVQDLL